MKITKKQIVKRCIKIKNVPKKFMFSSTIIGRSKKPNKSVLHMDLKPLNLIEILMKKTNQKHDVKDNQITQKIEEYLHEFMKSRNTGLKSKHSIDETLVHKIFQTSKTNLTIKEAFYEYKKMYQNSKISYSTFYRRVRKLGFTYRYNPIINIKSNYSEVDNVNLLFIGKLCECLLKNHKIFYLDEASFNENKHSKKMWVHKNIIKNIFNSGRVASISAMALISEDGVEHFKITETTFNSEDFIDFILAAENMFSESTKYKEHLIKKEITVICDNAKIHTSKLVRKKLKDSNINILWQPIYTPTFNTCELLWSLLKKTKNRKIFSNK